MEFGETLRQIRESRHLKQSDIANGLLSRTSISKIENNKQHPTYDSALELIANVGVTPSEFEYIRNNYHYTEKQLIIHKFMSLIQTSQIAAIAEVHSLCLVYLAKKYDQDVFHIQYILEALQAFDNGNFNESTAKAMLVWNDLENVDVWTQFDLFLINNILYFFPIDTAYEIAQLALRTLTEKYPQLTRLKGAFVMNISRLLMNNKRFSEAYSILSNELEIHRQNFRYDSLNLSYAYIAICQNDLTTAKKYRLLLANMGAQASADDITRYLEKLKLQ